MSLKYVQTNTFYLSGSGVIVGATSVTLPYFTDIYGNVLTMSDFGDKGYITFEPDSGNAESATFTGVTANSNGTYTLTGLKSSLAQDPYTESSGLVRNHAGGTKLVVTDTVAFWNTFGNKENDETIIGRWGSAVAPLNPNDYTNKDYVDNLVIAGAPDASTTVKGISKLSYAPVSPTNPIAVGDNDPRVPTQDENDALAGTSGTPSSTNKYVTQNDTTNAATITGTTISFTATSTISDSGNGFVTAGFQVGQTITVSGSGSNDGTYTITAVAAGAITVAETSIVNESAGASVTISAAVDGKVLRLNSSGELPNENNILGVGVDYQLFTANGTWTKPSWAKVVDVYVCGAGGGGGGGDNGNNTQGRLGGGGGGGGGISFKRFRASGLGSTETVTVGTGGTGGATTADGTDGGASSFGTTTLLKANGGSKGTGATGGAAGTGGAGGTATNGEIGIAGGAGGNGDGGLTPGHQGTDTATLFSARGGGGGGGRDTSANVAAGGTGGGFITNYVKAGGTAGATDTNGGAGQSSIGLIYCGTGGGGGGGSATTTPGNGGAGTNGSGGGGGGGGATGAAGAGGNGGDGFVIVISY